MRLLQNRLVPMVISLFLAASFSMSSGNDEIDVAGYASRGLIDSCDNLMDRLKSSRIIRETYREAELLIKDQREVYINGRRYWGMIIGCTGSGEFLLFDSCNATKVLLRKEMNIPGMHAVIDDAIDLNNDGNYEIQINLSAGAHGLYAYYLSVYDDSLSFIKNENGSVGFFALSGGIRPKDIDGDGIYELIVGGVVEKGQKENYTIHKWDGEKYIIYEKVAR